MNHLKKYNESVLGNLMNSERGKDNTDLYTYLGERNTPEWTQKLTDILNKYKGVNMLQCDINDINEMFEKKTGRGEDENNPVEYPPLTKAVNSRFGHCWFLGELDKRDNGKFSTLSVPLNWDICIQYFEDEYFLVNIGSGNAWYNYWYWCDQFHGLQQLIKDKLNQ